MYDPYAVYYPVSPLGVMLDVMLISSFMHMMMPPPIMIVHPSGAPIGTADTIKDHPESVEASAHDPGDIRRRTMAMAPATAT